MPSYRRSNSKKLAIERQLGKNGVYKKGGLYFLAWDDRPIGSSPEEADFNIKNIANEFPVLLKTSEVINDVGDSPRIIKIFATYCFTKESRALYNCDGEVFSSEYIEAAGLMGGSSEDVEDYLRKNLTTKVDWQFFLEKYYDYLRRRNQ